MTSARVSQAKKERTGPRPSVDQQGLAALKKSFNRNRLAQANAPEARCRQNMIKTIMFMPVFVAGFFFARIRQWPGGALARCWGNLRPVAFSSRLSL
ncbi:hypothetical protein [Rhizobium rhizosphaerae]|uniref:hypothetical protein n=1 Tax=Xaviernesmea rhizosphaerae TaxID=1672749 RepID=UPI00117A0A7A|nr:hypothetical protein [Xaviernesmea rhizosphaerae]